MLHLALSTADDPALPGPWLFIAEMEHRVANVYASAAASISSAARSASNEGERAACRAANNRLLAHAELHRAVQAPCGAGAVDLFAYLTTICEAASRADLSGRGAHLALCGESIEVEARRAWIVGLIVLELIINSVKHGSDGHGARIVIDLHRKGNQVLCRVVDDGPTTAVTRAGHGSGIIRALSAALGGDVATTFGCRGTAATLTFPEALHA